MGLIQGFIPSILSTCYHSASFESNLINSEKFQSVQDVQCRQIKCGRQGGQVFNVSSLPLIFNGCLPDMENCSMYTGVQFGRVHWKWRKHSVIYGGGLHCSVYGVRVRGLFKDMHTLSFRVNKGPPRDVML